MRRVPGMLPRKQVFWFGALVIQHDFVFDFFEAFARVLMRRFYPDAIGGSITF